MSRKTNGAANGAASTPIARIRAEIEALGDDEEALRVAAIEWAEIALTCKANANAVMEALPQLATDDPPSASSSARARGAAARIGRRHCDVESAGGELMAVGSSRNYGLPDHLGRLLPGKISIGQGKMRYVPEVPRTRKERRQTARRGCHPQGADALMVGYSYTRKWAKQPSAPRRRQQPAPLHPIPSCLHCGRETLHRHSLYHDLVVCLKCERALYRHVTKSTAMQQYQLTDEDLAVLRYWEPDISVPRKLYLLTEIEALVPAKKNSSSESE